MSLKNPFILAPDLYRWYFSGLVVASFLNFRDGAKAHAVKKELQTIYRHISLQRLYESLGANSRARKQAVRAALLVFYERTSRGHNLGAAASLSSWQNRGKYKSLGNAAFKVLTHYQSLNEETLMKLELKLYEKSDKNEERIPMPEVVLSMAMSDADMRELLKLAERIDEDDAKYAAKKPRKPRGPDSPEVKEKKRVAAIARHAKANTGS